MRLKVFILCLIALFVLSTPYSVNAGSFGKGDPFGPVGEWYIGEESSTPNSHSPVLFVHGYNSSSTTWWKENDMYDLFREAGYRTSFINLHPDKDMWVNGAILADKLEQIYDYYGEPLMVVAHSKGGLDTQSALVHFNAEQYVSKVFTLSSPHHGSELADLAHSNWASWLTGIIGARSEATESLQTGAMAQFRQETDPLTQELDVPFYTFSGYEPGSFGSALYWGGIYLNSYGENDGSVTVNHSKLSYAHERESGPWNHSEVKTGEYAYSFIEPLLHAESSYERQRNGYPYSSGTIVRGGEVEDILTEEFLVESDVDLASVHLLTNEEVHNAEFIAPDGTKHQAVSQQENEHSVFADAWISSFDIENPTPGNWQVQMEHTTGGEPLSYLLISGLEGGISGELHLDPFTTNVQVNEGSINSEDLSVTVHINDELIMNQGSISNFQSMSLLNKEEGAYSITIDIEGKTKKGELFERTLIQNIYIDSEGNQLIQ